LTSTLTRIRPERSDGKELRLKPAGRQRRPLLAAGSLVLIAASIAVFAGAYVRAGHQESVLVTANSVAQGQLLSPADLTTTRISLSSNVDAIPASEANAVVNRRVSVPLVAGTLLAPGDLTSNDSPPAGSAVVGVAIKSGQMPAEGIVPGDWVDVIMTGPPGSPDVSMSTASSDSQTGSEEGVGPGAVLGSNILVTAVSAAPASSGPDSVVASLLVPRLLAPAMANASAAGQAALVIVASRS